MVEHLEFSRIGLISGERIEFETDIIDPKGDGAKVTLKSRNYAAMEKMTREFLQRYPRSRKREAALFVLARSVQGISRAYICEIGVPAPGPPAGRYVFDIGPKILSGRSRLTQGGSWPRWTITIRQYPDGRYAAEVRNLRGMTLWRIHDWGKALDLTLAQLEDNSKRDLQPEASVRLANIFADLEQAEVRADLLTAIRTLHSRSSISNHSWSALRKTGNMANDTMPHASGIPWKGVLLLLDTGRVGHLSLSSRHSPGQLHAR